MGRRAKRTEPEGLFESDATPTERRPRKGTEIVALGPDEMMALAIRQGGEGKLQDVAEVIERLTRLKVEMQDREDRKELSRALAKAQRDFPPVPKSTVANITGNRGSFSYAYADLEQIVETVSPALRANGLALSWDSEVLDNGARMRTTCYVTHENGQSTSKSFTCPTSSSAGMSDQQKYASAQMFGRRKSLEQVLGLVAVDVPDAVAREQDPEPVTEEQAHTLGALLDEVGADRARFLAFFKIEALTALPARRYGEAVTMLEQKRKGAR